MQEVIDAVIQLGILPVIIGYLLFDQSKKMSAIEVQLVKVNERLSDMERKLESCKN